MAPQFSWRSPQARRSAATTSSHRSAPAAWARCIARAIRSWGARSRSRSYPGRSRRTRSVSRASSATQAGVILGTAAYMSPEQAKGRAADKRSDVWAFGCVLFELLTGTRAFAGEDVSDTLAAILRGEPDWAALPADLAPQVTAMLR